MVNVNGRRLRRTQQKEREKKRKKNKMGRKGKEKGKRDGGKRNVESGLKFGPRTLFSLSGIIILSFLRYHIVEMFCFHLLKQKIGRFLSSHLLFSVSSVPLSFSCCSRFRFNHVLGDREQQIFFA